MWCYYNSDENNTSNEPVPLYSTPRERETEKVLFTIKGNRILGCKSCNTSHSSAHCCTNIVKISEEEGIGVSLDEKIRRYKSLVTSYYYSINFVGRESCAHRSQDTNHYNSSSYGVHDCRSSFFQPFFLSLSRSIS